MKHIKLLTTLLSPIVIPLGITSLTISSCSYNSIQSISLDETEFKLAVGETKQLNAKISPDDAKDKTLIWSSLDESIATVKDGVVTAIKDGSTTIKVVAISNNNITATCKVNVYTKYLVKSINLGSDTNVEFDKPYQITPQILPDNAYDKSLTWTSSDPTIATVKDGLVTPVKIDPNPVTITASANDGSGVKATVKITVVNPLATKIVLDGTDFNLITNKEKYKTYQNHATVLPELAKQDVTWSCNPSTGVVSVDQTGKITALNNGRAKVRATANDGSGIYKECSVTVTTSVESIDLQTEPTLAVGEKRVISPTFTPANASNKMCWWSIEDEYSEYIKLTVDQTDSSKCTIEGLKTYSEPIPITVVTLDGWHESTYEITIV